MMMNILSGKVIKSAVLPRGVLGGGAGMLRKNNTVVTVIAAAGFGTSTGVPIKTEFYQQHVKLGGKMVDFAGYSLPVLYDGAGVMAEHLHTRSVASVFDVSHMGQVRIDGKDRVKFLESLVCGDIQGLKEGQARLSLFTNKNGGIIDDTIISNAGDHLFVVVNGACKHKDLAHMNAHLDAVKSTMDVKITHLTDLSLLALQGPQAASVLGKLLTMKDAASLSTMYFMNGKRMNVAGLDCRVTRCGYTGEDGFEVSVENSKAPLLLDALLSSGVAKPAGLGARDSLRLEAGLCLYGNDIDDTTNPIEAGLLWLIQKPRRTGAPFLGSDVILSKIASKVKPEKKRVGLLVNGAPARDHMVIYDTDNKTVIGEVTSGTFSPTLKKPIAMGYVKTSHAANGTNVSVLVRKNFVPAVVSSMPFVPSKYYSQPL